MLQILIFLHLAIAQIELPESSVTTNTIEEDEPMVYEVYEVTAYTAGPESTGKTPDHPQYGITASGVKVQENRTIACPESMEFGTEVYIPYFDTVFICQDRGGAITEGKLDIYMPVLADALEFGRRKIEVAILD